MQSTSLPLTLLSRLIHQHENCKTLLQQTANKLINNFPTQSQQTKERCLIEFSASAHVKVLSSLCKQAVGAKLLIAVNFILCQKRKTTKTEI
jgi:hypothetical protein